MAPLYDTCLYKGPLVYNKINELIRSAERWEQEQSPELRIGPSLCKMINLLFSIVVLPINFMSHGNSMQYSPCFSKPIS